MKRARPKHRRTKKRFRRQTGQGAVPGTVKTAPEADAPLISVMRYTPEEVDEHVNVSVEELATLSRSAGILWVNVDGLGDARTIRRIGDLFGLHTLALEDVVNVHQRAKVEEFPQHLFIVARMVSIQTRLETEQVSLFLGSRFVVTFQQSVGDCLDPVRERLRKNRGSVRQKGADYLAYALLDAIIDGYFPVMEHYGERLDQIEHDIEAVQDQHSITELHMVRGDLLNLRRTLWPHREVVNVLLRDEHPLINRETRLFLRDVGDHTIQLVDVAEIYRETCSDLREFHYAQIGQRTNEVMRVLTIIATIFMPLSFIVGLYGMNFDTRVSRWNMPELEWVYGYPFALSIMAAVTLGMLVFFWRRGWIGPSDQPSSTNGDQGETGDVRAM